MSRKPTKAALDELAEALTFIKKSPYKGTAVKIELEGQLNRGRHYDEEDTCENCGGDGRIYCQDCDEGSLSCDTCDGAGYVPVQGAGGGTTPCEDCEDGYVECDVCEGLSDWQCDDCGGYGVVQSDDRANWSEAGCFDFMLEHVIGKVYNQSLQERVAAAGELPVVRSSHDGHYDISSFQVIEGLKYAEFYRDGSVDSEFTFTVDFDHIDLALEFIKAFKALSVAIGGGLDTHGAGMHIAILNSPDCHYPGGNRLKDVCTYNFVDAVSPLLPALYFLGSADFRSRGTGFRRPYISSPWHNNAHKYAAINGRDGCFEFRVFETCYQRPEAVIDFLIVIAKALKYYSPKSVDTRMKIGRIGWKDQGEGLARFYYTSDHLKALDGGLRLLKPEYKSMEQLKQERGFNFGVGDIKKVEQERREEWRKEYEGVKERLSFERGRRYHRYLADYYQAMEQAGRTAVVEQYGTARQFATRRLREQYGHLYGGVRSYVRDRQRRENEENIQYFIEV